MSELDLFPFEQVEQPAFEPHQMIVLGRGVGDLTRQRALALKEYSVYNAPFLKHVVFSTGASIHAAGELPPNRRTEADIMEELASLPRNVSSARDEISGTTLENLIYSSELLLEGLPVRVLAHSNQMRRALYLGARVLGQPVTGVAAEDWGAQPETSSKLFSEKALLAKEVLLLAGVKHGDTRGLKQRAHAWRRLMQHAKPTERLPSETERYC